VVVTHSLGQQPPRAVGLLRISKRNNRLAFSVENFGSRLFLSVSLVLADLTVPADFAVSHNRI